MQKGACKIFISPVPIIIFCPSFSFIIHIIIIYGSRWQPFVAKVWFLFWLKHLLRPEFKGRYICSRVVLAVLYLKKSLSNLSCCSGCSLVYSSKNIESSSWSINNDISTWLFLIHWLLHVIYYLQIIWFSRQKKKMQVEKSYLLNNIY